MIGSTGFLGKVTLSMLLNRFPNVGKVYVSVRARSREESETRFWNNVITAPPFDPLREIYGDALEDFIRDKVVVLGGDIGETNLGYSEEEAQQIADNIDIVINTAGNVTFNPTLESALRTNVVGTQNVIAFTRRMKRPALVHVSTCFVAGNRSGAIFESDPVLGYFPRKDELKGVEFSVEQEIKDCAKLAERVREEARDAMMAARFETSLVSVCTTKVVMLTIRTHSDWRWPANAAGLDAHASDRPSVSAPRGGVGPTSTPTPNHWRATGRC